MLEAELPLWSKTKPQVIVDNEEMFAQNGNGYPVLFRTSYKQQIVPLSVCQQKGT